MFENLKFFKIINFNYQNVMLFYQNIIFILQFIFKKKKNSSNIILKLKRDNLVIFPWNFCSK